MVPFQINLQASIDLDTIFIYTRSWPPSIKTYNDPPKKNRNTGPQHKEIVHSTRVSGVRDTLWSNVAIKHHWWRHVPLKPSKTSIYVGKTCIYVGQKLHLCGKTYISVGFAWLHVWLPEGFSPLSIGLTPPRSSKQFPKIQSPSSKHVSPAILEGE